MYVKTKVGRANRKWLFYWRIPVEVKKKPLTVTDGDENSPNNKRTGYVNSNTNEKGQQDIRILK